MKKSARRFFATEVVQTSAMDCGPASLKSLLDSFYISVSYGRLREACQTDVDGTSIDNLEEIANALGLQAEQVMLPADHLWLDEAAALPALIVVRLPSGTTHFVIIWQQYGKWLQVMDPATGRRWQTREQLLRELFIHRMAVPRADWYEWACSDDFLLPLNRRLHNLGIDKHTANSLCTTSIDTGDWQTLATLDAATRLTTTLVSGKALRTGKEALAMLKTVQQRVLAEPEQATRLIPKSYWSVLPHTADEESNEEQVLLIGAVLLRIRGLRDAMEEDAAAPLSAELAAALEEKPIHPLSELFNLLRGDGVLSWTALLGGLLLAALGVIFEAVLLRGVLGLGHDLGLVPQRLAGAGYLLLFAFALLWLELQVTDALFRLGRRLETRLRIAVLERIPRLPDQYFRSRPVSDMAERSHAVHQLERLPPLAGQLLRAVFTLFATACAIAWLFPEGIFIVVMAVFFAIGLPLLFNNKFKELDLRARTHNGGLMQFYLNALQGLTVVRAHSAESIMQREQESLMTEWGGARLTLFRWQLLLEGLQEITSFAAAAGLLFSYAAHAYEPAGALLLAYWALSIPTLGEEIVLLARQYPSYNNLVLRLIEPLKTPVEKDSEPLVSTTQDSTLSGVAISLENVSIQAAGHTLLNEINLDFPAGSHTAIVGISGAGKSTLAGLLLGWHWATTGEVRIDGKLLDSQQLNNLRRDLVWIDPSIRLWNRSLLDNVTYGASEKTNLSWALNAAELLGIVERLPEGLQTLLGEAGGLLSGGEGQRVRVGRGLLRTAPRLVILDEPFRGLERPMRHALLERTRTHWQQSTLLFVSHDISETLSFERVLVVDNGQIVEDGNPAELAQNPDSHYYALLNAEVKVHEKIWGDPRWRRLRMEQGKVQESS
jgi:ATP-binding cassette subfamily B protein